MRDDLLTRMIRIYGFEHEAVILFAELIENPQIDDKILETIVKCHEAHPLQTEDE